MCHFAGVKGGDGGWFGELCVGLLGGLRVAAAAQMVGNVRRQVQQIAKTEQELAEAKEAEEHEKLKVGHSACHHPPVLTDSKDKLKY